MATFKLCSSNNFLIIFKKLKLEIALAIPEMTKTIFILKENQTSPKMNYLKTANPKQYIS